MGKKVNRINYRVEVVPRSAGDFGICSISGINRTEEEEVAVCEEIRDQIKRHVTVGYCEVLSDAEPVCEWCGWAWTEDEDSPHNGGCCGTDCEVLEKTEETD